MSKSQAKFKAVEKLLYNYKYTKADLWCARQTLKDIEEKYKLGVGATKYSDMPKGTDTSNPTEENAIDRIEYCGEVEKKIRNLERKIKYIDNALTVLTQEEMEIVDERYFQNKDWGYIFDKHNVSRATGYNWRKSIINKLIVLIPTRILEKGEI